MHDDPRKVFKPEIIEKYDGKSYSPLSNAPLKALSFLDERKISELDAKKITTVGELVAKKDVVLLWDPALLPLIDILICILNYPQHDAGPGCAWERLFADAPVSYYATSGIPFHTHFGPVFYRGRLDGSARVLVIGQDPSTDEILAQRVFVGSAGQIAQNFLSRLGLTRSYLMFNASLFGIQSGSFTDAVVTDPTIMNYRNRLFDRAASTNTLQAVIAFGSRANTAAINWPGLGGLPLIHLTHPTAPAGVAADWNSKFAAAHAAITPDYDGVVDATAYPTAGSMPTTDIPRRDLPFGIPSWHGSGGGTRSFRVGTAFETQITWTAP